MKTPNEATGAVLYLRVSTDEQVDNYSLGTQEDICKREVEKRNLQICKVFREEGRSAKNIKGRPSLIELLEYCRKNKRNISAVIVYRLDRISRQTADYLAIRKKLSECEIELVSATEPTGNTPTEMFIETMLAGFAQMDNDVRGERSRNGMKARFLAGLTSGYVPLGYLSQNGYAIKDPAAFDEVKAAWELMATGTKSLREIANMLNEQGLRGGRKKGKEPLLRFQTMSRIFHNKFYMGKVTSKKYGMEVDGQHPPMISEETFYRVQAILDGRSPELTESIAKRSHNNPDFPMRRLVKCSKCGGSFTGAWSQGKKQRYAYYFCRNRCGCPSVALNALEEATSALLGSVSLKPETVEVFNAFLRNTYYNRIAFWQKKKDQADVDLKELYKFRQSLIEKNISGIYSDEIFKEQNAILEGKIKDVMFVKSDEVMTKYNLESITKFIEDKFENLPETYKNSNLDQVRALMCSIFPSGLQWNYSGYSNTHISPFYKGIMAMKDGGVSFGSPKGIRTPVTRMKT